MEQASKRDQATIDQTRQQMADMKQKLSSTEQDMHIMRSGKDMVER